MHYYKVLKIDIDANENDIKKAYRKLAVKYHPDKNPNDKIAEEKFREVTAAYEILKDKEKRQKYDFIYGINILRIKKDNREIKTSGDIDSDRMNIKKPNVIIDPNGQVYVDVGGNNGIDTSFLNTFFTR